MNPSSLTSSQTNNRKRRMPGEDQQRPSTSAPRQHQNHQGRRFVTDLTVREALLLRGQITSVPQQQQQNGTTVPDNQPAPPTSAPQQQQPQRRQYHVRDINEKHFEAMLKKIEDSLQTSLNGDAGRDFSLKAAHRTRGYIADWLKELDSWQTKTVWRMEVDFETVEHIMGPTTSGVFDVNEAIAAVRQCMPLNSTFLETCLHQLHVAQKLFRYFDEMKCQPLNVLGALVELMSKPPPPFDGNVEWRNVIRELRNLSGMLSTGGDVGLISVKIVELSARLRKFDIAEKQKSAFKEVRDPIIWAMRQRRTRTDDRAPLDVPPTSANPEPAAETEGDARAPNDDTEPLALPSSSSDPEPSAPEPSAAEPSASEPLVNVARRENIGPSTSGSVVPLADLRMSRRKEKMALLAKSASFVLASFNFVETRPFREMLNEKHDFSADEVKQVFQEVYAPLRDRELALRGKRGALFVDFHSPEEDRLLSAFFTTLDSEFRRSTMVLVSKNLVDTPEYEVRMALSHHRLNVEHMVARKSEGHENWTDLKRLPSAGHIIAEFVDFFCLHTAFDGLLTKAENFARSVGKNSPLLRCRYPSLKADLSNCWGGKFLLIEVFLEVLASTVTTTFWQNYPDCKPTAKEREVGEKLVETLRPFMTAMKELQSDGSTASAVIPIFTSLAEHLDKKKDVFGSEVVAELFEESFWEKFDVWEPETVNELKCCTFFDPRYAFRQDLADIAWNKVARKIARNDGAAIELAPKTEEDPSCPAKSLQRSEQTPIEREIGEYETKLKDGRPGEEEDPLQWWREHKAELPLLAEKARHFLAIPSTSCDSSRLKRFPSSTSYVPPYTKLSSLEREMLTVNSYERLESPNSKTFKCLENDEEKRSTGRKKEALRARTLASIAEALTISYTPFGIVETPPFREILLTTVGIWKFTAEDVRNKVREMSATHQEAARRELSGKKVCGLLIKRSTEMSSSFDVDSLFLVHTDENMCRRTTYIGSDSRSISETLQRACDQVGVRKDSIQWVVSNDHMMVNFFRNYETSSETINYPSAADILSAFMERVCTGYWVTVSRKTFEIVKKLEVRDIRVRFERVAARLGLNEDCLKRGSVDEPDFMKMFGWLIEHIAAIEVLRILPQLGSSMLNPDELQWAEQTVGVMQRVYQMYVKLSHPDSTASAIVPKLLMLRAHLVQCNEAGSLDAETLETFRAQTATLIEHKELRLATFLDPRWSQNTQLPIDWRELQTEICRRHEHAASVAPPPAKRPPLDLDATPSEDLKAKRRRLSMLQGDIRIFKTELRRKEDRLHLDPLDWWRQRRTTIPVLAPIAERYLAMSSSTPSHQLSFSPQVLEHPDFKSITNEMLTLNAREQMETRSEDVTQPEQGSSSST